jgi:hypothetical protein
LQTQREIVLWNLKMILIDGQMFMELAARQLSCHTISVVVDTVFMQQPSTAQAWGTHTRTK